MARALRTLLIIFGPPLAFLVAWRGLMAAAGNAGRTYDRLKRRRG
jgi:hypothetical protein